MASAIAQGHNRRPLCPLCPMCAGEMELIHQRYNQQVCVCRDCHTGVTIPLSAIEVQKLKREGRWKAAP